MKPDESSESRVLEKQWKMIKFDNISLILAISDLIYDYFPSIHSLSVNS